MCNILRTFTLNTFRKLASLSPFHNKMVRYFPNKYRDYWPGAAEINKDEIIAQIDQHVMLIMNRLEPSHRKVDGGLYIGVTGVAYMFYRLAKHPLFSDKKAMYMDKAMEYLKPALETSAGDKTSFLLGDAGTYALATVLQREANVNYSDSLSMYMGLYSDYLNPKFLKCGADEFFVGRAGYLAGALWLRRELKMKIYKDDELHKICDVIVTSGRNYSRNRRSPCPLMYHYYDTQYLGAAHGVSFILQMLLTVPGYLDFNKSAAQDIQATVEFIASLQSDEGNWPCTMNEVNLTEHKLVHWCHGAPGIVYLMARAYLVYKDQKFLNACIKAGEVVWHKGLLYKGPGLCHGVAGNGYVFLLLYRLTGEEKYLYKAKVFGYFMNTEEFLTRSRVPDNCKSLYEGTAGTVCYLSDLLLPDRAEFPFQDVFYEY